MRFETGKSYKVYDKGFVKIESRTACYVTFTGDWQGRKQIRQDGLFRGNEYILIDSEIMKNFKYFVVAKDVVA